MRSRRDRPDAADTDDTSPLSAAGRLDARFDHRFDIRLDEHLREVLLRADGLVPSEGGAILLDDPRSKRMGQHRLTVIGRFGMMDQRCALGARLPAYEGFEGTIYRQGVPLATADVIGVPVVIGKSICGVLELWGRRADPIVPPVVPPVVEKDKADPIDTRLRYTPRDLEILRIFAAYISSSIQNALDALYARELTRRDNLTGLYNDRFLHDRLTDEIERAESYHAPYNGPQVSLLFLDLDDFKHVNDQYGHLAGSRTLRELAPVLQSNLPQRAICARYGGDEFVAILPDTSSGAAHELAESLRLSIAQAKLLTGTDDLLPASVRAQGIHVTCSIGVANYHDHVSPFGSIDRRQNALLHLADAAMYAAKSKGKNRVELAPPED